MRSSDHIAQAATGPTTAAAPSGFTGGRPIAVLSGLAAGLVSGWLASSAGAGATLATGLLIGAAVCGLALLLTDLVRLIELVRS